VRGEVQVVGGGRRPLRALVLRQYLRRARLVRLLVGDAKLRRLGRLRENAGAAGDLGRPVLEERRHVGEVRLIAERRGHEGQERQRVGRPPRGERVEARLYEVPRERAGGGPLRRREQDRGALSRVELVAEHELERRSRQLRVAEQG